MLKYITKNFILRKFYKIPLSNVERDMADDAVSNKYTPALQQALFFSILLIPALLLLETQIVVSILIPTTMVAGTAWFAVSLASMKKKFEGFGTELTTDLFVAFTLSLVMLFLATLASLTEGLWGPTIAAFGNPPWLKAVSAFLAMIVVAKLLYSIFAGSLKYDVNDAMLTGQNEAAERFFKKSLSLLHSTAELLKSGKNLDVANYSIGLAFYEVFSNLRERDIGPMGDIDELLEKANKLIKDPAMQQPPADAIALELAQQFFNGCQSNIPEVAEHKSYLALQVELECLKKNQTESQFMKDTRLSVVFSEMSNLLEEFGSALFESNT